MEIPPQRPPGVVSKKTKTCMICVGCCRGRLAYQLGLSVWRLLCLCYYAEARLEVLKLTKHMEDGTVKARWRVHGLPFHSLLRRFYRKDKSLLYRLSFKKLSKTIHLFHRCQANRCHS